MNLTAQRKVEPLLISFSGSFEEKDIIEAFEQQTDPDEMLFYNAFSSYWNNAPMSERLTILARIAKLAEDAELKLTTLNLQASQPEMKG